MFMGTSKGFSTSRSGLSACRSRRQCTIWMDGASGQKEVNSITDARGNRYGTRVQAPANGSTAVSYAHIAMDTQLACQLPSYLFFWDFGIAVICGAGTIFL
jgi:hypothetical protein